MNTNEDVIKVDDETYVLITDEVDFCDLLEGVKSYVYIENNGYEDIQFFAGNNLELKEVNNDNFETGRILFCKILNIEAIPSGRITSVEIHGSENI